MIPDFMVSLANHMWQSTIFTVAIFLMTLTLRKNSAAVRHRLWFAASVKFLIPFSLLASVGNQFESAPVSILVKTVSQPFAVSSDALLIPIAATTAPPQSLVPAVLIAIWICGFATSLLWSWILWRRIRQTMRRAIPLSLDVPIRAMSCRDRFEPGVFGIVRPVLLLPEGIGDQLSPSQLKAVLAHELCHVRRRDNLTTAIHMFVEALFWFHPLVWWIKVRLIDEQERACDEEVLRMTGDPETYAEAILNVCKFYQKAPVACVSGVTGSDLKKRIRSIMTQNIIRKMGIGKKLLVAGAGIAAVATPIAFGMARTTKTELPPQIVTSVRKLTALASVGAPRPQLFSNPAPVISSTAVPARAPQPLSQRPAPPPQGQPQPIPAEDSQKILPLSPSPDAVSPNAVVVSQGAFVLGPGDELEILVWREPDFQKRVVVRPDGKISFPLIGDVQAAGLTPAQLADKVRKDLSMLSDPQVSVIVTDVRSQVVHIGGNIERPGAFPLTGPLTLFELIVRAGGFKDAANLEQIQIIRRRGQVTQRFIFNYQTFVQGKLTQNISLVAGDMVIVP